MGSQAIPTYDELHLTMTLIHGAPRCYTRVAWVRVSAGWFSTEAWWRGQFPDPPHPSSPLPNGRFTTVLACRESACGEAGGIRTHDTRLKRPFVLYLPGGTCNTCSAPSFQQASCTTFVAESPAQST